MATNQSRTVELKIKLAGVQTLEDLEQVTSDINSELKAIPINSKAFNEMSALAKKANSQIKEIDNNLEGVTSVQKTESLFKLGEGLAGAFAIASSASLLFGEKTSEQLTEVVTKVGSLVLALDGLKKISEAFSAENIKGLKGIVAGFKESTIAAKLFGAGARTALISTGILAFVVALGTVVAYWDEINGFFQNNAEKKALEENIKLRGEEIESFKAIQAQYDRALSVAEKQNQIDGDTKKLADARVDQLKITNELINKQITQNEDLYKKAKAEFDKSVKDGDFKSGMDERNAENKLIALQNENKLLEDQRNLNLDLIFQEATKSLLSSEIDANAELLRLKKDELVVLNSKEHSERKIYETNKQIIEAQIEQIKLTTSNGIGGYDLNKIDEARLDTLNAQLQALNNTEAIRQKNLIIAKENYDLEIKSLENQRSLNEEVLKHYTYYSKLKSDRESSLSLLDLENQTLDKQLSTEIKIGSTYENTLQKRIDNVLTELNIKKELAEAGIEELTIQNQLNLKQIDYNNTLKNFYTNKLKGKLTEEERLEILNKISSVESEINALNSSIVDNNASINTSLNESLTIQEKISDTINTRYFEGEKLLKRAAQATTDAGIADDKRFKNVVERNKEVIQASADLISGVFDLEIAQQERKAELESRKLEEIQKQKEGYAKKNEDLNEQLKDAEGELYDDILAKIKINDQAIAASAEAELNSKRIIAEAEWKAAKARKRQAVIDATIQGSLAVIEALPNVLLAVLVGALSAIQIGTILSQPVPDKENFAGGGVVQPQLGKPNTGDKINAGVNPYEVVLNGEQQANLLFKLANSSGYVSPNGSTNSGIDYDLMADKIGRVLAANPSFVSVAEVTAAQNRLKVVENRASL